MKAVCAPTVNRVDPLVVLVVGEQPEPQIHPLWSAVSVHAVAVNYHDAWSSQGMGLVAEQTPTTLGIDTVDVLDEGTPGKHGLKADGEVVLYTFASTGDAGMTSGKRRTTLSEKYPGAMVERTSVPSANVFAKSASLITAEMAVLGANWLTVHLLLFNAAGIKPSNSVFIQGTGGGVPTTTIQPAHAAGLEVSVISCDVDKRSKAPKPGMNTALEIGARLPRRVNVVIESVGVATWSHSMKSVRPDDIIVIHGATTDDQLSTEPTRLFFQDVRVQGCTMGSREDPARLLRFVGHANLHPTIDSMVSRLDAASEAFVRMIAGDMFGKIAIEL